MIVTLKMLFLGFLESILGVLVFQVKASMSFVEMPVFV